jgi:2-hydroxy-3-oxopropionate reductase
MVRLAMASAGAASGNEEKQAKNPHPESTIMTSGPGARMASPVGFIGLGLMGAPMARNLMRAGYDLVVQNRSREKAAELAREGATAASTPREVAERCEIVFTMLPDSPDVEQVVTGRDGILEGIRAGALLVDMSSISPVVTRQLAARVAGRGAAMLDAPVSGGDVGAVNATLSIMVGGAAEDFARAKPFFEAMGRTIVHVGESGAGQVTKAANQVVVALTIAAVSEALVLGSQGGVAPAKILEVLGGGLAGNRVMEVKREKFLSRTFEPGFRAELHHKDLGIALSAAREYGVVLPLTAVVDQLYLVMRKKGWGEDDHSGLLRVVEDLAGLRPDG